MTPLITDSDDQFCGNGSKIQFESNKNANNLNARYFGSP